MPRAILYDATQCIDCKQCEQACATKNNLAYNDNIAKEQKTSDHKYTYVSDQHGDKYMRRLCMHCNDPACVSVCPVGALEKTKNGPVTYDADKCMGCRYCMVACPYGIPKYEWTKAIPTVRKCIMCPDLTAKGEPTACASACPTGATIVGEREAMIAEARKRINANPSQYINHIYGERELGGAGVLLLSAAPFAQFGLPTKYGDEALPPLTGHVLAHVPDVVTVGFSLLGGIYWITHRREIVAAAERRRNGAPDQNSDEE